MNSATLDMNDKFGLLYRVLLEWVLWRYMTAFLSHCTIICWPVVSVELKKLVFQASRKRYIILFSEDFDT